MKWPVLNFEIHCFCLISVSRSELRCSLSDCYIFRNDIRFAMNSLSFKRNHSACLHKFGTSYSSIQTEFIPIFKPDRNFNKNRNRVLISCKHKLSFILECDRDWWWKGQAGTHAYISIMTALRDTPTNWNTKLRMINKIIVLYHM